MTTEMETDSVKSVDPNQIMNFLSEDETICFKSQQRGENDLTKAEKIDIALNIYNKSKLQFLSRFGKYLQKNQLDFFEQFTQNCDDSVEIAIVLKDFSSASQRNAETTVKNRRYVALQHMIYENSYFSEIEMMKRNPLLYEQLVGQYLSAEEKMQRDRSNVNERSTLVQVLMEGIERDDAKIKQKEQEKVEEDMREEEEEETMDSDPESEPEVVTKFTQWGEFEDEQTVRRIETRKAAHITPQEQELLKDEFISLMYESFLTGKDEDFDYATVDDSDKYDNVNMNEIDEESKYFDSEEPETVQPAGDVESEDELDVFMSGLDQNPSVSQLSEDIQRL